MNALHQNNRELWQWFRRSISVMLLMVCTGVLFGGISQTRTISGQVVDKSGAPYLGVTIMVKGSSSATLTDKDGNFTLSNIKEGDEILLSAIGEKKMTVKVGKENFYKVTMGKSVVAMNKRIPVEPSDPTELERIGLSYITGKGVERDLDTAISWYKKAAEKGSVIALYQLGFCYDSKQDHSQAIIWYTKAAEKGLPVAQFKLSEYYGKEKNADKEVYWLIKAGEQNYAPAQFRMGMILLNDKQYKKYEEGILIWLTRAANNGSRGAEEQLRQIFEKKLLDVRGYSDYEDWLTYVVSRISSNEINTNTKQLDFAQYKMCWDNVTYANKLAQQEYPEAQYILAVLLEYADPYDDKYKEYWIKYDASNPLVGSAYWLKKACENGWVKAFQLYARYCYNECGNVKGGVAEAIRWSQESLNKQSYNWKQQVNLQYYYLLDDDKTNDALAISKLAKLLDNSECDNSVYKTVALAYYYGIGVEKDPVLGMQIFQASLSAKSLDNGVGTMCLNYCIYDAYKGVSMLQNMEAVKVGLSYYRKLDGSEFTLDDLLHEITVYNNKFSNKKTFGYLDLNFY